MLCAVLFGTHFCFSTVRVHWCLAFPVSDMAVWLELKPCANVSSPPLEMVMTSSPSAPELYLRSHHRARGNDSECYGDVYLGLLVDCSLLRMFEL